MGSGLAVRPARPTYLRLVGVAHVPHLAGKELASSRGEGPGLLGTKTHAWNTVASPVRRGRGEVRPICPGFRSLEEGHQSPLQSAGRGKRGRTHWGSSQGSRPACRGWEAAGRQGAPPCPPRSPSITKQVSYWEGGEKDSLTHGPASPPPPPSLPPPSPPGQPPTQQMSTTSGPVPCSLH